MKKLIGYIMCAAGLLILTIGVGLFSIDTPILKTLKPIYIIILSLVIITIGIIPLIRKQEKQSSKEVPIYKGKKIVGYRVMN
jgi:membrane protein YdbS with pleckstrin-like domain